MSGYFGTAYGITPKVWKLGREALALIECDKIDEQERERERAMSGEICLMCSDTLERESLLCERCEKESEN